MGVDEVSDQLSHPWHHALYNLAGTLAEIAHDDALSEQDADMLINAADAVEALVALARAVVALHRRPCHYDSSGYCIGHYMHRGSQCPIAWAAAIVFAAEDPR